MTLSNALDALKRRLAVLNVDIFIVFSGDAHQSEYVHDSEDRRGFISNFTGSAGTALISVTGRSLLWTDGRYFLQASQQLDMNEWILMRSGEKGVLNMEEWVIENVAEGSVVAVDPLLVSASQAKKFQKVFNEKNIILKALDTNPIDEIWGENRPAPPCGSIRLLNIDTTGQSHLEKIERLQSELTKRGADSILITMLDEICWLFNIRGSDVSYNPVAISYALVTQFEVNLFIDHTKLSACAPLAGVNVRPYHEIQHFLATQSSIGKILVDPAQCNWKLYSIVGEAALESESPLTMLKSVKNAVELQGIRECHIRDGVALTAFLSWLEKRVKSAPDTFTEFDVVQKIEEFRGRLEGHVSPSFSTIAGYGPNGAIIHYKPECETASPLGIEKPFLLDSGGQYIDGTTDVTRTVHFGTPTDWMRECFTMVLKGHIALARVVFPEGILGSRLDTLARAPLWSLGLDYNHGTGHGVGAFLCVHEGPQGISFRKRDNEGAFFVGMTTSNEPGYYEEGNFGIRIENVCITVETSLIHTPPGRRFCRFETVTMTPIQKRMINVDLLDDVELKWLNDYHAMVREKLQPLMSEIFPEDIQYLLDETSLLTR